MNCLCQNIPDGLECLVDYFDTTYVTGTGRSIRRPIAASNTQIRIIVRRVPPLYPIDIWNVHHEATLLGRNRANDLCESWNNGLLQIVGHYHPSVWTLTDALRQDNAIAETDIAQSQAVKQSTSEEACSVGPKAFNRPAPGTSAGNLQRSRDQSQVCCWDIKCCCAHHSFSVATDVLITIYI